MRDGRFARTELIFGKSAIEKLSRFKVAVFGLGGVGGYVVESLARSGVGKLDLIDSDVICLSNINRQIYATTKTIGQYKVDVARQRILEINPDAEVKTYKVFFDSKSESLFNFSQYDYVVDAIDSVSSKIKLIERVSQAKIKMISSMGAGNKIDPTLFEVADIYETSVCPLAKVLRRELKTRGIKKLKVVFSKEKPITFERSSEGKVIGSTSFVPAVVGLIISGEVVKDLVC